MYWGVKVQVMARPTKNAKGMAFTSERRARTKGKSIFYHAIMDGEIICLKFQNTKNKKRLMKDLIRDKVTYYRPIEQPNLPIY